ncbi:protein SIEVE ELEMENT OCCLUSION B-like [Fagus crenata]
MANEKSNKCLFDFTEHEILSQIYATHVYDKEKLDVASLFTMAKNTLNRATCAVDKALSMGASAPTDEKILDASFSPPLSTLKLISYEMQCCKSNTQCEENDLMIHIQNKALSILKMLSGYSWDAKAVLTLASFALDYGESCVLAQSQSSQSEDDLAKSVRTLKQTPVLLNATQLQKHKQDFVDLNKVIKETLEVTQCIFELVKQSNYDTNDVADLETVLMGHIEVDVYWAIVTIVAITTQLSYLIRDESKKQELNDFAEKLKVIKTKLNKKIEIYKGHKEKTEAYSKLVKVIQTSTEITVLLKELINPRSNIPPLTDGSTSRPVDIDVVKEKNVLLLISDLNISDEDIALLKIIYNELKKEERHKIVWIPFLEERTDSQEKEYKSLQSKIVECQIPWYIHNSTMAHCKLSEESCRFIREQWHYKDKPSIVVLNSQAQVKCQNAIHMIRAYGFGAYPFTNAVEENLLREEGWIVFTTNHVTQRACGIKEKKHILLFGGHEKGIQNFDEKAKTLVTVSTDKLIKEKDISIQLVPIGKDNFEHFWSGVESLFISQAQRRTRIDNEGSIVRKEIQKLLSFKNESTTWAVLSTGPSVVMVNEINTVMKVLDEFSEWKGKALKTTFKEYFESGNTIEKKETSQGRDCCHMEIPFIPGITPEPMTCSQCKASMETYIKFNCCHMALKDAAANKRP